MFDLNHQERKTLFFISFLLLLGTVVAYVNRQKPEWLNVSKPGFSAPEEKIKVDINTAGFSELIRIPGIGPVLAERIIDYRQRSGDFSSIDELKRVKGIGDNKLDKMRVYIYLN